MTAWYPSCSDRGREPLLPTTLLRGIRYTRYFPAFVETVVRKLKASFLFTVTEMPGRRSRGRPKRLRSSSAPAVMRSPKKIVKRKQWSERSMLAALEAVKSGSSIKRAALQHGVPRSTLQDRFNGRVVHGTNPGVRPYLERDEEKELCDFLVTVGEIGYGKTRRQVKDIAESVAREKGLLKKEKISDGWFRRFLERNPSLRLRKGDSTCTARMSAMENKEAIESYFDVLKYVLDEHGLQDRPAQIYNVDESGVPLDHRAPRVLVKKGQRKVRYRTSGNKNQVTVVGCVNAAGSAMPPFVIFDAKSLNMEWTVGEVPGTTYGLSANGWIDMELFKGWFTNHFLRHAVSARPLLLLLDGQFPLQSRGHSSCKGE